MSKLLIDGYNLLHASGSLDPHGTGEVDELLEALRRYKKQKRHAITIVFDGYAGGMPIEREDKIKGLRVIYTRLGEKADQVIERLVGRYGGSCVVVTSDRELADSVESDGASVITSGEFAERLEMTEYFALKGEPEEAEEGASRIDTRKKGNPKRKSKKERARIRRLRKI